MRKLAADIGMSEVNLHRCVNNNKMQASDLERIAALLGVDVGVFFGQGRDAPRVTQTGDNRVAAGRDANVSDSPSTERALEELAAQREMFGRTVDRLLAIIEGVTGCANPGQRK